MQNSNTQNTIEAVYVKKTGQKESFWQTVLEIWAYRQMIISFVRRDLRGRYKGSVFGFLWTFINPLLQLMVYTIVFTVIMPSGIENYHLHLFVALIPWIFFSASVTGGSTSVLSYKDMVKKIYFPREVLPISTVTTNFVNMLLCFVVVFAVAFGSGYVPVTGEHFLALLYLIPLFIIEYVLSLGVAFFAAAITVYFRDMEHIFGILVMAWQFLTPVLYNFDQIKNETVRTVFYLNPMAPIIKGYRDIIYHQTIPAGALELLYSFVIGLVMLVIGWLVFEKLKRRFAEEL